MIEVMNQKADALIQGTKCDSDGAPIFTSSVDSPEEEKPLITIDSTSKIINSSNKCDVCIGGESLDIRNNDNQLI